MENAKTPEPAQTDGGFLTATERRMIDQLNEAGKERIQKHRDEAYQNGWDDGYAEGLGKAAAYMEARAVESDELEKLHTNDGFGRGAYFARCAARERRELASDFRAMAIRSDATPTESN